MTTPLFGNTGAMSLGVPDVYQLTAARMDPGALSRLDALLLDERGRMRLHPAATYRALDQTELRYWANARARYTLPTVELIDWLRARIAGRKAIEIGAGMGDVGLHLGVKMTDSGVQSRNPAVLAWYASKGCVSTNPPPGVIICDANKAVKRFKPDVVIGCFITQLFKNGDDVRGIGSSVYGVDEGKLLRRVREYIHVGATSVHFQKRILEQEHDELSFPWIVTRAHDQSTNRIWIWHRRGR